VRALQVAAELGSFDSVTRHGQFLRLSGTSLGLEELGAIGADLERAAAARDVIEIQLIADRLANLLDRLRPP
jgi:hypothetical protein